MLEALQTPIIIGVIIAVLIIYVRSTIKGKRQQRIITKAVAKALEKERRKQENEKNQNAK